MTVGILLEDYNRAIAKAVAEKSEFISSGKVESFDRYKELAGEIRGLKLAGSLFKDVIKRHGDIDDDE